MEEQRIFTRFINVFVYFITKQWFARFLKMFITKVISNIYTTALSLFVPSAPPWDCLLSPPCSPPLCVPFICSRLNLSLHISKEPYIIANRIGKQTPSLYAPTVPPWLPLLYFNNPPFPPFLRVTFLLNPKLRRFLIISKVWRTNNQLPLTKPPRICLPIAPPDSIHENNRILAVFKHIPLKKHTLKKSTLH